MFCTPMQLKNKADKINWEYIPQLEWQSHVQNSQISIKQWIHILHCSNSWMTVLTLLIPKQFDVSAVQFRENVIIFIFSRFFWN